MAPRTSPKTSPARILFIVHLSQGNSTSAAIPLKVPQKKQQEFYTGIGSQQPQQNGVARSNAPQSIRERFAPRQHGQSCLEPIEVGEKRRNIRIARGWINTFGLSSDGTEGWWR